MEKDHLNILKNKVKHELYNNIIPFWTTMVIDTENGGFIGRMNNSLKVQKEAPKGLINNTRLLWTYSAFYRTDPQDIFLQLASKAFEYLEQNFLDKKEKGVFWSLTANGRPLDTKKRIYGHAFYIYALSEYYLATCKNKALQLAVEYFKLIEEKSYDKENKGYFETFNRDWSVPEDMRLSEIDMNEKKSMNTHLHILEAYTSLYKIWPDDSLRNKLQELVLLFCEVIIDVKHSHFKLFFNEIWQSKSDIISYGHDIEGSWLLYEAAHALGSEELLKRVKPLCLSMAQKVYERGLDADGGLFNEGTLKGVIDTDKHWWPQAEAVIGFVNAWQLSGQEHFISAAIKTWEFIENSIIDQKYGEWFWKVSQEGQPDMLQPKVSEWKGPYHNGRACLEILKRLA